MPISSSTVKVGGTFNITNGTDVVLISKGQSPGSNELFLDDGSALLMQPSLTVKSKAPVPNAASPNGYTQQRSTLVYCKPITLANGEVTVCTCRIEVSADPEASDAILWDLQSVGAAALVNIDFIKLFQDGSTA